MKRSKTPSTYIKPNRARRFNKKKKTNQHNNISKFSSSGQEVAFRENKSSFLINNREREIGMSDSNVIISKNSSAGIRQEYSNAMFSKFTQMSSIAQLQSKIDFKISQKKSKK